MKNGLLALSIIVLCACSGKKESVDMIQIPTVAKVKYTDNVLPTFNYLNNNESFTVKPEVIKGELLTDTMKLHSSIKWLDSLQPQMDNVYLTLYDGPFGIRSHVDSTYTYYKHIFKAPLNDSTYLSAELYAGNRDINASPDFYNRVKFYITGDTIHTVNIPEDAGNFTSEGLTFKVSGEKVTSVSASYKAFYNACISEYKYARSDSWSYVCPFVTEEIPLSVVDCSYTLPVVEALEISSADWKKMEEFRPEAIKKWESWTGQTMNTTKLVYFFELEHFLINLNVTYTDGTIRCYQHVTSAVDCEP